MQRAFEICIPRVEKKTPRDEIFKTICKLKIGYIEKFIEIPLKTDDNYKRIILKIKLNESTQAVNIRSRLENGDPVNIVYDMPWYWQLKKVTQQR